MSILIILRIYHCHNGVRDRSTEDEETSNGPTEDTRGPSDPGTVGPTKHGGGSKLGVDISAGRLGEGA